MMAEQTEGPTVETNPITGLGERVEQAASEAQGFLSMVMAALIRAVQTEYPDAFENNARAYVNANAFRENPLTIDVTAHITANIAGRGVRIQIEAQ